MHRARGERMKQNIKLKMIGVMIMIVMIGW